MEALRKAQSAAAPGAGAAAVAAAEGIAGAVAVDVGDANHIDEHPQLWGKVWEIVQKAAMDKRGGQWKDGDYEVCKAAATEGKPCVFCVSWRIKQYINYHGRLL